MKGKKGRKAKRTSVRRTKPKRALTKLATGVVTRWQVVKARIQAELTSQVTGRGFSGVVCLRHDELEYQHDGTSDRIPQTDLEKFATSMLEKKLASSAATDGHQVSITLTPSTISILGGTKTTSRLHGAFQQRPPRQSSEPKKLTVPSPDKLMMSILGHTMGKPKQYADVRKAVAAQFSISPERIKASVTDPETRQQTSFADSFNTAVGHLQKASLLATDGKKLAALPNPDGKPIPAYEPKRRKLKPHSGPMTTARISGRLDVQRLIKSLPDQDPYRLLSMWKNAVRITDDKAQSHLHREAMQMATMISKEWERRAKTLADDAYFRWPTTEALGGRKYGQYRDLRQEGMLRYLEYKVGKDGEHSSYRHALLSRIFENALPPVFDRLYMAEWGPNSSSIRLHKMAHCLASFAKNFKYQDNDKYDEAIRHWEQDLEYLHDRYYVGRFGFGWPTTVI